MKSPGIAKIKPLNKLVRKALDAHSRHRDRHRPTGCSFALSDHVDYFDPQRWDELTSGHSVFLSRRYLRVLEDAGPENVRQRYAMIFHGRQPLAAVAAQAITTSADRVPKTMPRKPIVKTLERIEQQILVCGNLLSWGFHGVAFHPNADRRLAWAGVAEALYRIRRADRLFGNTDLVMVKDVTDPHASDAEELTRFSYRALETEPNMVLTLPPSWRSYSDYLAGLKSDYRKHAVKIAKTVEGAGCRVESLSNLEAHTGALHALYLAVHERQKMRLVTLPPAFLPSLAASFGSDFRCTVVRRDDQLLGFVTTLRDGDTAVGYYPFK